MRIWAWTALAIGTIMLASCASKRTVSDQETGYLPEKDKIVEMAAERNIKAECISSKIKLKLSSGKDDLSVSGTLKMRRDKVIRLQLMAFGIVEAGRLELTPDYVLLMDRINKQYVKVSYSGVDFLKKSGLNFHSLQALFWNELFLPGEINLADSLLNLFGTTLEGDTATISFSKGNMNYSWMVSAKDGSIWKADIRHLSGAGLEWTYDSPKTFEDSLFPTSNTIKLQLAGREAEMQIDLSSLSTNGDWETQTTISSKYKEVELDYILSRLLSM